MKTLSVVIITRNEGTELEATVLNLLGNAGPQQLEILVVDDGSNDGSTAFLDRYTEIRILRSDGIGVAQARNLGARAATGDAIVFCDAHVRAPRNWCAPLMEMLSDKTVGGVAPAIYSLTEPDRVGYGLSLTGPELHTQWHHRESTGPASAPILPGCFLAMRREVFEETGGLDPGMRQLGGNDNELSFRLWTLGYKQMILPDLLVGHLFRKSTPYEATWTAVVHNRLRMALVHFDRPRTERVIDALRNYFVFPASLAMTLESDFRERRNLIANARKFDDHWYFQNVQPGEGDTI